MVEAEGVPLARLEIDRRSWVRLPLAAPLPEKLVFRANTLGASAELDLRPLCFRVFRMDWEQRLPKGIASRFVAGLGASHRVRQPVDRGLERDAACDQQAGARRSAGAADGAGFAAPAAHLEGVSGVGRRGRAGGERHPARRAEARQAKGHAAGERDLSRRVPASRRAMAGGN